MMDQVKRGLMLVKVWDGRYCGKLTTDTHKEAGAGRGGTSTVRKREKEGGVGERLCHSLVL